MIIKSLSFNQQEIIQNIINLYIPSGQIDLDPTYSKGIFYKHSSFPEPKLKYDINPLFPEVNCGDCRNLPLANNSINSIMFDPPFLATTGPSLKQDKDNNHINKRFSVYQNEIALFRMYYDSLKEFYRILALNGILIFKCQDKISSGKQYMSHIYICNMAEELGFYIKDLFVLGSQSRIIANWQKKQQHSRKFHCYFLVLEKVKKQKMSYLQLKEKINV